MAESNQVNEFPEDLLTLIAYSEKSPSGAVYTRFNNSLRPDQRKYSGDIAGTLTNNGSGNFCWTISFRRKRYYLHRLLYKLVVGELKDDMVVDHIDGNSLNNKVENLRLVYAKINSRNRKTDPRNKSGTTGVRLEYKLISGKVYEYWASHVIVGKRVKSKRFNIKTYGYDKAFCMAKNWREEMIELLNNSGAGYTDRHGTLN